MKITKKKIVAATLVPAAVAGITASSLAVVQAATDQPGHAQAASTHQVRHAKAGQARQANPIAQHAAKPAAHHSGHDKAGKPDAAAVNQVRHHKAKAGHAAHRKAVRHAHAKRAAAAQPATSMFAGMSSFERCVAWRESGDNPTASSAGLFGILPSTWASLGYPGTAGGSSVALQKQAFNRLYAMDGTSPWAPYDGC